MRDREPTVTCEQCGKPGLTQEEWDILEPDGPILCQECIADLEDGGPDARRSGHDDWERGLYGKAQW